MLVTLAGYVALVVVVGRLLAYLSKYAKSPVKVKSLGDWALVTGATDGIGEFSSSFLAPTGTLAAMVCHYTSAMVAKFCSSSDFEHLCQYIYSFSK